LATGTKIKFQLLAQEYQESFGSPKLEGEELLATEYQATHHGQYQNHDLDAAAYYLHHRCNIGAMFHLSCFLHHPRFHVH
jgi:hypothetical protein